MFDNIYSTKVKWVNLKEEVEDLILILAFEIENDEEWVAQFFVQPKPK